MPVFQRLLSKSLKFVNLILFLMPNTYAAVHKQLVNIQMYPEFNVAILAVASALLCP
jgi:hypothetical protein